MQDKIDIIIPAYKAHATLNRALASIAVQQGVENFKITIVNDCCPEGDYQKIIKPYKHMMDIQEIKLEKNSGPGVARQTGIDKTNYPYIMFLDADDLFGHPYAITNLLQVLKESKTGKICSGSFIEKTILIDRDGSAKDFDSPHIEDMTWCFSKIYERSFLEKYFIKFPPLRGNEDATFNFMCSTINQLKEDHTSIVMADTLVYIWSNNRSDSITRINDHQYALDQSICGLVDGIIYYDEWLKKVDINREDVLPGYLAWFFTLYKNYNAILQSERLSCLKDQCWFYAKKFYWILLKDLWPKISLQQLQDAYTDRMNADYAHERGEPVPTEDGCIPVVSFWDFVNRIDEEGFNPEDLKEIHKNLPQDIKNYNIKCGVCAADYYN